jgi:hypothetical protein
MADPIAPSYGLSGLCSVTWDSEMQSYQRSDATEEMQCCLSECTEPVKFCNNYCHSMHDPSTEDHAKCTRACAYQKYICSSACSLMNKVWYKDNYLKTCAFGAGCIKDSWPVKECLQKNKQQIIRCCQNACIPTRDVGCSSFCDYAYELMEEMGDSSDPKLDGSYAKVESVDIPGAPDVDKTPLYVGISVTAAILAAAIFLYFIRSRKVHRN